MKFSNLKYNLILIINRIMNLELSNLLPKKHTYYSFNDYKVGYFYNITEQKYLNCNNETKKQSILTTVPSEPWTVRDNPSNGSYTFLCGNGHVMDIAWEDTVVTYPSHGGENQQFKVEVIKSKRVDKILIHFEKGNSCLTGNVGRIFLDACKGKTVKHSGQRWYWLPKKIVDKKLFKRMRQDLDR